MHFGCVDPLNTTFNTKGHDTTTSFVCSLCALSEREAGLCCVFCAEVKFVRVLVACEMQRIMMGERGVG